MARHSCRARFTSPNLSSAARCAAASSMPFARSSRRRIARWKSSSASTSSSTLGRPSRSGKRLRKSTAVLDGQQHLRDGSREALPLGRAGREALPPRGRDLVELGLAAQLRHAPVSLQPAALLHAIERRVQRAVLDLQHVRGALFQPARNGVAVARCRGDSLEDQRFERAVEEFVLGRHVLDYLGILGLHTQIVKALDGDGRISFSACFYRSVDRVDARYGSGTPRSLQITEAMTHLAFYAGWSKATSGLVAVTKAPGK